MKRTVGAGIGAALFIVFMSYIATRLAPPVSAASAAPAYVTSSAR